jgi:hypothetical protein
LRKKLHSHFVQQRGTQYHVICYLPKQPECGSQNESWCFNLPSGVRLTTRLPKTSMENGSRRRAVRHRHASENWACWATVYGPFRLRHIGITHRDFVALYHACNVGVFITTSISQGCESFYYSACSSRHSISDRLDPIAYRKLSPNTR